jgi:metallo-beta-lactamase class B
VNKIGLALTSICLIVAAGANARPQAQTSVADPNTPIRCDSCDDWNAEVAPARIHGNTFYVGPKGASSVAVTTKDGIVLLDVPLPQSVPVIERHLERLGLRLVDVTAILTSHGHFDHVGGVAALAARTGATVYASDATADALRRGGPVPDDPQFAFHVNFPAFASVRIVRDSRPVTIGGVVFTPHLTPGHTPGATTWTWQACDDGGRCLNVVYADSLNAISHDDFRFTAVPGRVDAFARGIDTVSALPCDAMVSVHQDWKRPFIAPGLCAAYAAEARAKLAERVAKERGGG